MRAHKKTVFIDLDETLIYAQELRLPTANSLKNSRCVGNYEVIVRSEAHRILQVCREGGRPVYLFTNAVFGFALEVSRVFDFGFGDSSIFSLAMILNCRRGLCPDGVLIENKPPSAEPTREKMNALGIPPEQVWELPSFEPPAFPTAKLFLLGLPLRLARHDERRRR